MLGCAVSNWNPGDSIHVGHRTLRRFWVPYPADTGRTLKLNIIPLSWCSAMWQ